MFRPHEAESQAIMMYADDFACVCDTQEDLQRAINICKRCIDYFNLRANVKKSAVMRFSGDDEKTFEKELFTWGENGTKLPFISSLEKEKRHYKYLGLKMDPWMR